MNIAIQTLLALVSDKTFAPRTLRRGFVEGKNQIGLNSSYEYTVIDRLTRAAVMFSRWVLRFIIHSVRSSLQLKHRHSPMRLTRVLSRHNLKYTGGRSNLPDQPLRTASVAA